LPRYYSQHQINYLSDVLLGQRMKDNDAINTIEKLRAEGFL